jgi:hypothetical protein
MTTIATQQPDAIDGVNGGTYAGNVTLNGTITVANELTLTSTNYTFPQPVAAGVDPLGDQHYWKITNHGTYGYVWVQTDVAAARRLIIPFTNLPNQGELESVSVYIDGGDAKAGLPGSYPFIDVRSRLISTGVESSIGTVIDAPADLPAYKLYHILGPIGGATPLTVENGHSCDGTEEFSVDISGEYNGGGATVLDVWVVSVTVVVTCTAIAPG